MKTFDKNTFGDIYEFKSLVVINKIYESTSKSNQKKITCFINNLNKTCQDFLEIENMSFRFKLCQLAKSDYLKNADYLKSIDTDLMTYTKCFINAKFNIILKATQQQIIQDSKKSDLQLVKEKIKKRSWEIYCLSSKIK